MIFGVLHGVPAWPDGMLSGRQLENSWGFVAAAIVPTLAPILAEQRGWTSVILVCAAVVILGIIGFLLTKTNQPLRGTADAPVHV